jgi:CRISPR/Cas system-associated endoribonuclease Cas2
MYVLIYYIKSARTGVRLKVNRCLRRAGAKRIQHSVWELENLQLLQELARAIKDSGGRAIILKKEEIGAEGSLEV